MHWEQIIENQRQRQLAEESGQVKTGVLTVPLDRAQVQNLQSIPLDDLFLDPSIAAATREFFGDAIGRKNPAKWEKPEDYADPVPTLDLHEKAPEVTPIIYNMNTAKLGNWLSPVLVPNYKQYRQPFWERSVSFLQHLLDGDIAPVVAKTASDVAIYNVAPSAVNAAYWIKKQSENPKVQKAAIRLGKLAPLFALMATPSVPEYQTPKTQATAAEYSSTIDRDRASGTVTIDLSKVPLTYCSENSPMIVKTELGSFVETDPVMCRRIMEAVPAPSAFFTQYNENIAVRAREDGSFVFRLVVFKEGVQTLDDLLKENPKGSFFGIEKVRQAYADTYRFKTHSTDSTVKKIFADTEKYAAAESARRTGKSYSQEDLGLGQTEVVQHALKYRENHQIESMAHSPISAKNYRAAIGGWLITPLPLHFFLGKWYRESTFNANAQNEKGSARGLNQFTIATFLTIVKKYGNSLGLNDLRDRVMTISAKHGHKDKITVKDADFIKLFREESVNPNYSTAFGVLNTASKAARMQDRVDSGDVALPNGRKTLNVTDIMLVHYFGDNVKIIWDEMNKGSTRPLRAALPSDVYQPNSNDIKDLTAPEFYSKIARASGFGLREVNVRRFFKDDHGRQFAKDLKPFQSINGIGTKFRLVANENTANQVTTLQARPNVDWISSQYRGIGVEPIQAPAAR